MLRPHELICTAHSLIDEEVILHTFVRNRQHDYRIGQSL